MTSSTTTLRMGVADVLGDAFVRSLSARTASAAGPGLLARWKAYRADRKRLREFVEVNEMARHYAETMPSLAAELQAIMARDPE